MTAHVRSISPRLMGETDAARYVGLSPSTLRKTGIPRRKHGVRRLYDRMDLDAYIDSLPYEGGEENPCDEIFGVQR